MAATGADGLASARREADAWGNDLASWSTGLWAVPAGGWGHNTKAFDPAADLVYMHQRWYDPKTGTFASSAPYPPMIEHRYGFAANNPVQAVDPDGRRPDCFDWWNPADWIRCKIARPLTDHYLRDTVESMADYSNEMSAAMGSDTRQDADEVLNTISEGGTTVGVGVAAALVPMDRAIRILSKGSAVAKRKPKDKFHDYIRDRSIHGRDSRYSVNLDTGEVFQNFGPLEDRKIPVVQLEEFKK